MLLSNTESSAYNSRYINQSTENLYGASYQAWTEAFNDVEYMHTDSERNEMKNKLDIKKQKFNLLYYF